MRRLFEILQEILRRYPDISANQIGAKFKILFDGYRTMFDQSFSKSKDLGDILKFLPGVVVQNHMIMQGMADLYGIKLDLLERLIESTIEPLKPSPYSQSRYKLDDHLSGFLQDQVRSQLHYCDPILQHISICRRLLSLLDRSNAFDLHPHDLFDYVNFHFYNHLCAATTVFQYEQNISDDHPAVAILHGLETTAYYVEGSGYTLGRCIIRAILIWAYILKCRLKGVAVSVSNADLMERVCHLTNKIYREILCITKHKRMTYITMGGLGFHWYHLQVSAFSEFSPHYGIVLSWDLLAWLSVVKNRVLCSFTNFITTPEFSGPLYISADIYHTQITEYSLQTIYRRNHQPSPLNRSLMPNWSFREHLSHALPTEMILYILRSIRSESLILDYSSELMLDTLEIIVKWLQGLGSERPSDLCDRFQGELLRHKSL